MPTPEQIQALLAKSKAQNQRSQNTRKEAKRTREWAANEQAKIKADAKKCLQLMKEMEELDEKVKQRIIADELRAWPKPRNKSQKLAGGAF
mmetsp:Transcript_4272/g.6095  ORF Transcript_4272/g.6095 Transcript_4272/m.6095 type:complete len:91 (-) Transcript_4272:16-288(-)